ncbi:MAG: PEP/pyruvate-binding domain-containing protein [Candidatus Sigynarchaeota archaeon]
MSRQPASQGTGMPSLDAVITGLRPGDNVVFQVDKVLDYMPFVRLFCDDVVKNGHKLIYFRFASHAPLLPGDIAADRHDLNPAAGFEAFIGSILSIIERAGKGACYVFDCMSDLAADWYSDIMLGNFFQLTCPYLFDFDTFAYFALVRNRHASQVIEAIQNTAQVIIDVYHHGDGIYVHPIKVFKRHSPTMYMLHELRGKDLVPITRSSDVARFFSDTLHSRFDFTETRVDTWKVTLQHASTVIDRMTAGIISAEENERVQQKLLRMFIAREQRLLELASKYLHLPELLSIGKRMIGTGLIGGKAVGMLLAQAIINKKAPALAARLELQDSFFIGSDVFYTYLVRNHAWWGRRRLSNPATFLEGIEETRLRILEGSFPPYIIEQFVHMLDYFGQSPIIVRSSSLLEDAYGNAFSGKYTSIFCPNQGTPEQRLAKFVDAVKAIYASTINENALAYRHSRNLLDKDEQMALLVMRVSGDVHGKYFFPQIAGVGYSFNPFAWSRDIDPKAGLLRLVFGLGTRAVDRKDDYTRLVALNNPTERILKSEQAIKKYSQKRVDMLDLQENTFISPFFYKVSSEIRGSLPMHLFSATGDVLTLDEVLSKTDFPKDMRLLLKILEDAYSNPVDIEFTANFSSNTEYSINVLQCRPFQVKREIHVVDRPGEIHEDQLIFKTEGPIIGTSMAIAIDILVYVEPERYGQLAERDRYHIARSIGRINAHPSCKGRKIAILGPGRWGTAMSSLGIPVTFSEISNVSIIGEIAEMHQGLIPDVSLGTHFFNDLVEFDILYFALYPGRKGYIIRKDTIDHLPNSLEDLVDDASNLRDVLKVIDTKRCGDHRVIKMYMNSMEQRGFCYLEL